MNFKDTCSLTSNTLWIVTGLEWRQKSWSFKNAVNDTVHEMLDLNHKTSSAHVSITTKKNTPPNQNSQGNVQICEMKTKKGPVVN